MDHHARSKHSIDEVSPATSPGTLGKSPETSENSPETSPYEAPSDYEESVVAHISDDPEFLSESDPHREME